MSRRPRRSKSVADQAGVRPVVAPLPAANEVAGPVTPKPRPLAEELRGVVAELLFISESESPFSLVELPKDAILPDALRVLVDLPPDAPAEEWTIRDMLTPRTVIEEGAVDDDRGTAARFGAVQDFLEKKLAHSVAYKLGTVKKTVFFMGRQPDKSWLGLQTEAVET